MPTKKLISDRRMLLGTITYPDAWEADRLSRRDHFLRVATRPWVSFAFDPKGCEEAMIQVFAIADGHSWQYPDAVRLCGITPEDFEKEPRCSFAPSAAYIRSLLGKD